MCLAPYLPGGMDVAIAVESATSVLPKEQELIPEY
jgi:hypothetical protein